MAWRKRQVTGPRSGIPLNRKRLPLGHKAEASTISLSVPHESFTAAYQYITDVLPEFHA